MVTADGNYGVPIGRDVAGPWQEVDHLLAEPFIRGRELTTAVLGGEALLVTELRPKSGFYDFDAKYTDGMTEHICPANIPDEITEACQAIEIGRALCRAIVGQSVLSTVGAVLLKTKKVIIRIGDLTTDL